MKVKVAKQSIGKRRPVYIDYIIGHEINTLEALISVVVTQEVERFNAAIEAGDNPQPIEEDVIWRNAEVGKIGFNAKYNVSTQDLQQALETAFLGYKDGLYRVFVDGKEIETLDERISLKENSEITFIRLTFLSGRRW